MRKVVVAREELERIIKLCENVERRGLDPFTVNIRELLERLRRMVEENPDLDHYVIDAETLYRISALIALQHKWLREKAKALFIDAQMISTRLVAMDKKALVKAFLKAWHPIISLEQMTPQRLRQGLEHFLSLPPRGGGREFGWKITDREMELIKAKLELEEKAMMEKVKALHHELLRRFEERGEPLDYWEFIKGESFDETFERAYLLSFLITDGYVDVKRNPLKNEVKLIPHREQVKRRSPTSLVISLGGGAR